MTKDDTNYPLPTRMTERCVYTSATAECGWFAVTKDGQGFYFDMGHDDNVAENAADARGLLRTLNARFSKVER